MAAGGSTGVVMVALATNLAIAVAKFTAAALTASSAMLSEAIHSLVGTSNLALLLLGLRSSARPADARHPFGYSREIYFWSFIVAILLFSMGAGVAIYEGVHKLAAPHPVTDPHINYIVLAVALVLKGISTWKAVSVFNERRGPQGMFAALRSSKDPALFTVVLEDLAAMAGLLVALTGIFLADRYSIAEADGIASIVIGLILGFVAAFMSIEIQALIVGEAADPAVQAGIAGIIAGETGDPGDGRPIRYVNEIRTVHLGPQDILVAASFDFQDGETARGVEATIGRLDRRIREVYPQVQRLYLKVQSEDDQWSGLGTAPHQRTAAARMGSTGAAGLPARAELPAAALVPVPAGDEKASAAPSTLAAGSLPAAPAATTVLRGPADTPVTVAVTATTGVPVLTTIADEGSAKSPAPPPAQSSGKSIASVSPRLAARPPSAKKKGRRKKR